MTGLDKMSRKELLGLMIDAEESNNKELLADVMKAMTKQQTNYGAKAKQKRGFFTKGEEDK